MIIAGENSLVTFFLDVGTVEEQHVQLVEGDLFEEEGKEKVEVLKASVLGSARWFASSRAGKSKMFARPCYTKLLALVEKHWSEENTKHILLLGTPGTGKTYFLNYVAQVLLSEKERDFDIVIAFSTFAMWVSPTGEYATEALEDGNIPLRFQQYLEIRETIVLFDCTGSGHCQPPGMAKCKVLVTSSPEFSKYNHYQRQVCQTLYMPLWNFEELELCRQECFPDIQAETLVKNFHLWGGVARYTIGDAAHNAAINLEEALGLMNFSGAEDLVKRWQTLDVQGTAVSHRLVHAQTSDMYHISCQFASQYVCDKVFSGLVSEEEEKCKRFLATNNDSIFAAMRGQFHESYCHRYLAQQRNVTVRLLEDEDENKNEETYFIDLGERILKRFDDLSELTGSDYGVPNTQNFAAVDSVAFPNLAFSMTISHIHPTVSTGLRKLMAKMAEGNNKLEYLVFVVPNHMARDFKKQKYWNTAKKQYLQRLPAEIQSLKQAVLGVEYK
jgi:DNA polymerase III delta prime subunit